MSNLDDKIKSALAIIDKYVNESGAKRMFALCSGGHDSLTITHLASQHPSFTGVIHINTGIGIPQTNQFVRDTCAEHGWPLFELHPATKYLQLVIANGFPGAGVHSLMYRMLKERPLEAFLGEVRSQIEDVHTSGGTGKGKKAKPIVLCGGTRSQESVRRMGNVMVMHKRGANVWLAPIHDWTALDTTNYIARNGLKRNPVKDMMHISGECLCGCFADPTERRELAMWFPEVDAELTKYEEVVRFTCSKQLSGHSIPVKQQTWGWQDGVPTEQLELFPLCHYCHAGRSGEVGAGGAILSLDPTFGRKGELENDEEKEKEINEEEKVTDFFSLDYADRESLLEKLYAVDNVTSGGSHE